MPSCDSRFVELHRRAAERFDPSAAGMARRRAPPTVRPAPALATTRAPRLCDLNVRTTTPSSSNADTATRPGWRRDIAPPMGQPPSEVRSVGFGKLPHADRLVPWTRSLASRYFPDGMRNITSEGTSCRGKLSRTTRSFRSTCTGNSQAPACEHPHNSAMACGACPLGEPDGRRRECDETRLERQVSTRVLHHGTRTRFGAQTRDSGDEHVNSRCPRGFEVHDGRTGALARQLPLVRQES